MRNILLLEPNYQNKFPPIGLMKIATYYRKQGDNVVFYKGDLKEFIIKQITEECITKLFEIDSSVNWNFQFSNILIYIKTRKKEFFKKIEVKNSDYAILIETWIDYYKNYYHKEIYKQHPKWDKVCITTLFTFYWDITIETIQFAKDLVKSQKDIMVGGVMATILFKEIENETGIKPHRGLLNTPGELDRGNTDIIDELHIDYSILEEIDYKYSISNAYYGYTTRGCIRKCPFCAVPVLEPKYCDYIPLTERIAEISNLYGERKDLVLMDNNVLASKKFSEIVEDIKRCGFVKGAKYYEPNFFELTIANLKNGINDIAYTRKAYNLIIELEGKIRDFEKKKFIYNIREQFNLLKLETSTKENIINASSALFELFEKYRSKVPSQRYVDFNQGVDARLITKENAKLLGEIAIKPLRIAFDDMKSCKDYEQAIKWSAESGINYFSNYLLYNYKDDPIDLYQRLKINVELCEKLNVTIYSFPMKYHPIKGEYSLNRNFIGENWNRKYIRAVQAILNSTKGKIGRGKSFFDRAFGKDENEFSRIIEMPETFILYRLFFEWLEEKNWDISTKKWEDDIYSLNKTDMEEALKIIHTADFKNIRDKTNNPRVLNVLKYYTNSREEIIRKGTELFNLKKEYDELQKNIDVDFT
jgi:hypothetical protein